MPLKETDKPGHCPLKREMVPEIVGLAVRLEIDRHQELADFRAVFRNRLPEEIG
jgi:hypothetical protein